MRKQGMVIALVSLLPGAALAADTGPYAGIGGGMYYAKVNTGGFGDFDDSAELFRVYGGFDINEYVSVQADYVAFGDTEDSFFGTKVKLENGDAWELAVRPTLPINEHFDLFARLGWSWYSFDVSASGFGSDSNDNDDFVWGVGGTWYPDTHWGVRAEYSAIDVSGGDLDMWTLSALYRFR